MKLSLEGIGAVLQRDDDYTAIREIVPGGPAAMSGKFKIGDRIVGVGQGESGPIADVIGWRLDDVVDKIRGAKDTTVRLEILPADAGQDGKHVLVALVRKKVVRRGAGGEEFDHRNQGRRCDAPYRRDHPADVLSGFRRAPPRRQELQERHARCRQAARRPEEAEGRGRGDRSAQRWRRLAQRGDRSDRPVHRQGAGRAGAQRRRAGRPRKRTSIPAWSGAVRSRCWSTATRRRLRKSSPRRFRITAAA